MLVVAPIMESARGEQLRGVKPNAHWQNVSAVPIGGNCCKKTTAKLTVSRSAALQLLQYPAERSAFG
jgi:hypothetical protein